MPLFVTCILDFSYFLSHNNFKFKQYLTITISSQTFYSHGFVTYREVTHYQTLLAHKLSFWLGFSGKLVL